MKELVFLWSHQMEIVENSTSAKKSCFVPNSGTDSTVLLYDFEAVIFIRPVGYLFLVKKLNTIVHVESNGCSYALSEQSVLHVYFLKWSQHALGVTLCLVIYASVLSLSQQELVFMWEIWSWSIMLQSSFQGVWLTGRQNFFKVRFLCSSRWHDVETKQMKWN